MVAEITLADLLAWEPRLRLRREDAAAREREVTWSVTARATAPLLPALRGGEIVILPERALAEAHAESALALPALLRELAGHQIAAVVLDGAPAAPVPLPVLASALDLAELEGTINRLLTERRGELYRAGTELGRTLAGLTTAGAGVPRIVAAAGEALRLPIAVLDGQARVVAAWPGDGVTAPRATDGLVAIPLPDGASLRVGPVPPAERAWARLAAERVAVAVEAALARAARERPRGPARAAALAALIAGTAAPEAAALLPTNAGYRVALASPAVAPGELTRALAPVGTVHEAAVVGGYPAAIVETTGNGPPVLPELVKGTTAWIALSGRVRGAARVPEAGRQATYLAGLRAANHLHGAIVRFDAVEETGAYQALYPLWGTPALAEFVVGALGNLPAEDRRGTLRTTLLAFCAAGGSHVEAARQLGIHRNTLAYRLHQIAALTTLDPEDAAARLPLHLALLAATLPPAPALP